MSRLFRLVLCLAVLPLCGCDFGDYATRMDESRSRLQAAAKAALATNTPNSPQAAPKSGAPAGNPKSDGGRPDE